LDSSSEYGKRLTQAREKMGITLEEVSYELKINLGALKKLEASDTKNLPKPGFTKGFIKTYAKFLKISPALIIDEYMQTLDSAKSEVSGSVLVETSEPKDFFIVDFLKEKFFPLILFVSVIAAVLILYTFLGNYENSQMANIDPLEQDKMIDVTPDPEEISFDVFDDAPDPDKKVIIKDVKDVKKEALDVVVEKFTNFENEVALDDAEADVEEPPKYVPPTGKHKLVVEPLANTYLYIKTNNDSRPIRATLIPDKIRSFRFDQAEIRFVDAGAVNVILDGEELGALGVFGQEKKLDFPSLKEL
jgi:cytoskeletal protein RodZ